MTSAVLKLARQIDYLSQSRAPLETYGAPHESGVYEKKLADYESLISKPAFSLNDLPAFVDALRNKNGVGLDDRQLLLEKMITIMSRLKNHPASQKIQEYVITLLYNDLQRPPASYLCTADTSGPGKALANTPSVRYVFRSADGSNYNPASPSMGKAGSPYARSVPSKLLLPISSLPDPGLIFDTLLLRDKYVEHPGGLSSLFFAFADLVTHSIFDTSRSNPGINNASSYLDLSILYGSSEAAVDSVRRKDGTGRLWNDVFADARLLHMPPATCALLVLLSRNHNYTAQRILDINENGIYKKTFATEEQRLTQDDEIFHRARLVTCGYFLNIILGDYVGAILGLVRDGSDWRLDPLMKIRNSEHELENVGQGNAVSAEFNLLYRWHAALSEQDADMTTAMFDKFFDGKDPKDVDLDDLKKAAHMYMIPTKPVREWTFKNFKRDSQGRFDDDDLANALQDATEWRASAFKARGVPAAMRIIEIMGIQQARAWGTCSLNEFRKFIGLKPYNTFKEWNPDPEIHATAQLLYKDINNLELYVGLQAEEPKAPGPGAGLCPGYTMSRAILADAVCLTRGDPFFTSNFSPSNLTSWGLQDCQLDKEDGSYGGLLTKLLFRTLPNHYPRRSAYAHFPFIQPQFMKETLNERDPALAGKYTWTRPVRQPKIVPIKSYAGVTQVLSDSHFIPASDARLFTVVEPTITKWMVKGFWRNYEKPVKTVREELDKAKTDVFRIVMANPNSLSCYFARKTKELLETGSFSGKGYVDIIHDVVNMLPVHWIAQEIAGLPVKTLTNPHGAWPEQETYQMFSDIAQYVHLNFNQENDWRFRESSQVHCEKIVEFIEEHIGKLASLVPFSLSDTFSHIAVQSHHSHSFLKRVHNALGKQFTHREIASQVFATVVPTAAIFSATVARLVDFFLDDAQSQARKEISQLFKSPEKYSEANEKIQAYIREAIRLNHPVPGCYRTAGREAVVGPHVVQAFEVVYSSFTAANLDHSAFGPHPSVPDYSPTQPDKAQGILGFNENSLMSEQFLFATIPPILGVIFEHDRIRRGPGASGHFTTFQETLHESPRQLYIDCGGAISPFPASLLIQQRTTALHVAATSSMDLEEYDTLADM